MLKTVDVNFEDTKIFNTIFIETSARCNRHCSFCPNAGPGRAQELMPEELVQKMLNELAAVNYSGLIHWYIYNEPLLDPRLCDFVKVARQMLPKARQGINTNGDFIKSAADITKLLDAGMRSIQINCYAVSKEPGAVEGAKRREAKMIGYKAEIELEGKYQIDDELSVYRHGPDSKVCLKVEPKYDFDPTNRGAGLQFLSNRSGNIPGFLPALAEPMSKMCTRPFRQLNINWKGDAILCCNDYHGVATFGNIRNNTLTGLWNSTAFHTYRLKLQNKRRDCFLCDVCDFNGGTYTHQIAKVTFGAEVDATLINADLRKRSSIFNQQQA